MSGGKQNEPTTSSQIRVTRDRFELDIVMGDYPPYYLVPENLKETYKLYDLPYNAGRCKVSWDTGNFNFEWS